MILTYDIGTMPISVFFKIAYTNDLKYIFINQSKLNQVDEKIIALWESIVKEYNEIIDEGANLVQESENEIVSNLKYKYIILNNCIKVLCVHQDEEIIQTLINNGYRYDRMNIESSIKDLYRQLESLYRKWQMKHNEYCEKYDKEKQKDETKKEYDYFGLISMLERHRGHQILAELTPIIKLAYYIKEYKIWQQAVEESRKTT